MIPLVLGLGVPELLIILAVVLLLFGGSRLAGLGKSSGRALREFKEETKSLKPDENPPPATGGQVPPPPASEFSAPPPSNLADPDDPEPPQRPLS